MIYCNVKARCFVRRKIMIIFHVRKQLVSCSKAAIFYDLHHGFIFRRMYGNDNILFKRTSIIYKLFIHIKNIFAIITLLIHSERLKPIVPKYNILTLRKMISIILFYIRPIIFRCIYTMKQLFL